jgi:E3 ubiquitin-protein ligase HUWE1
MGAGAAEILPDLGVLHRACIWENVLLKAQIPEKESEPEGNLLSSLQSPGGPSSNEPAVAANGANTSSTTVTPTEVPAQEGPRESDPREENAKAFRHLANQIPGALSPFFQCITSFTTYLTDVLIPQFPHSDREVVFDPSQSRRSAKATNSRLSLQRC